MAKRPKAARRRRPQRRTPPKPASRLRQTIWLEREDLETLEREKARRRARMGRTRGVADLSALVREAIRARFRT